MQTKGTAAFILAAMLTGCASQSANMRVGTDMSYLSISEQREASRAIRVLTEMPAQGQVLGVVDASRCHRNTLEAAPTDEALMGDLKVAAYARGGDAIINVETTKESGLLKNCWYIVTARATVLQLSK